MSEAVRGYLTRDSCDLWDILCDGEYFEVSLSLAVKILTSDLGLGHLYNSTILDSGNWRFSIWGYHSQGSTDLWTVYRLE